MYENTYMHKKISHSCLGWFTEKYILRQFLSIYYISLHEFKYLSIIQKNLIFMHQIMIVGSLIW